MLALAEELDTKINSLARDLATIRFREIVGVAAVVTIAAVRDFALTARVAAIVLVGTYTLYAELILARTSMRERRRDRHALSQLVEILRETGEIVARREAWSPLRLAQFRVRLARFEIGDPGVDTNRLLRDLDQYRSETGFRMALLDAAEAVAAIESSVHSPIPSLMSENSVANLRKVLSFNRAQPLLIALPGLLTPDSSRKAVAVEDIRASQIVLKSAIAAMPGLDVTFALSDEVHIPDNRNMALVCSPKRNQLAAAVLNSGLIRNLFDVEFAELYRSTTGPRWAIVFAGRKIESPSYDQHELAEGSALRPADYSLTDFALLARVPNPWYQDSKVLIVAGIRAFGTWGAAEFLASRSHEIAAHTDGRDFAMVLKVALIGSHVEAEATEYFRVVDDLGP